MRNRQTFEHEHRKQIRKYPFMINGFPSQQKQHEFPQPATENQQRRDIATPYLYPTIKYYNTLSSIQVLTSQVVSNSRHLQSSSTHSAFRGVNTAFPQ